MRYLVRVVHADTEELGDARLAGQVGHRADEKLARLSCDDEDFRVPRRDRAPTARSGA